jgi:hypothetical protein
MDEKLSASSKFRSWGGGGGGGGDDGCKTDRQSLKPFGWMKKRTGLFEVWIHGRAGDDADDAGCKIDGDDFILLDG